MKKLMALAVFAALNLLVAPGFAADAAKSAAPAAAPATAPPAAPAAAPAMAPATDKTAAAPKENSQNNKMKECQAQAGEKKLEGQKRQDFVNTCLKAKPATAESKMAMCNKKTAGLKGDERNKAQSECMKGPA